jgi:hypothetical protein
MSAPQGNGLDAINDQPAKTLTKHATDFIARCKLFTGGFYLSRGIDAGLCVAFALLLLQAALMVAWEVL